MLQTNLNKLVFKECASCASSSELQASHTIPRFVFDWLRDTSATGHFRSSQIPGLRVQDGPKLRMLCKSCKLMFPCWETALAEKCFVPPNCASARKVLLGLMAGSKEDHETVPAFFQDLRNRNLGELLLVVSDGGAGVIKATETRFPRSGRQRCLAHRMRNLACKVPC